MTRRFAPWAAAGVGLGLLLCAACESRPGNEAVPAPVAAEAKRSVLAELYADKSRYDPGEPVRLTLQLDNASGERLEDGRLLVQYRHLGRLVESKTFKKLKLDSGEARTLSWEWKPPQDDFAGYSVEAWMENKDGRTIDHRNAAVDVSSDWTRFPRYGYLSRFPKQDGKTTESNVESLSRYQINALQFYDWQFKHHAPLAGTPENPAAEWTDIGNRVTSGDTIRAYIDAAHKRGMAAMNYNLLYGAYDDYETDGSGVKKEWGLYAAPGGESQDSIPLPDGWATPKLDLFDPGNPDWQKHLLERERDAFAAYPFDGWHVDQLGFRGMMYTYEGKEIEPSAGFAPFLNRARSELGKTIVFNNVGTYGVSGTADAGTAFLYEEMWENSGQTTYNDLKKVLDEAAGLTEGKKATVLAAYMNYNYGNSFTDDNPGEFNEPGVLLTEATIFANGGSHIELGDDLRMLSNEYFPNRHLRMSDSLKSKLLSYYRFLVAYQNVLRDGQMPVDRKIAVEGAEVSADGRPGTVWAFSRAGGKFETLQLINLTGVQSDQWRDADASAKEPETRRDLAVKLYAGGKKIKRAFLASPDLEEGTGRPLAYETGRDSNGDYVAFAVPELRYWDMVALEYE